MSEATDKLIDTGANIANGFLNKAVEYLSSAEAFLKAEVPAFIQELLAWNFYEALIGLIFKLTVVLLLIILAKFCYNKGKNYIKDYSSDDGFVGWYIGTGVSLFAALFITAMTYCNIITMVKIKTAPRVFLIEQIKHMR